MRVLIGALFIMFSAVSTAQEYPFLDIEKELVNLRQKVLDAKKNQEREQANILFAEAMEEALMTKGSFSHPFDSIPMITVQASPDNIFRIINWNLPLDNQTFKYFAFVQYFNSSKKEHQVYKLNDRSHELFAPLKKSLKHDNWYGALYYKIIPMKKKKSKYYVLLGWDGNNRITNKKLIDAIYFTGSGKPRFGAPIFRYPKTLQKRVIFEYSADVVMSLKYDEKNEQLVFDHLSPKNDLLEGQYQYYGPDLSFDAFELKDNRWYFIEDVDIRMGKDKILDSVDPPRK